MPQLQSSTLAAFKALDETSQRSALGRMSDDAKRTLLSELQSTPNSNQAIIDAQAARYGGGGATKKVSAPLTDVDTMPWWKRAAQGALENVPTLSQLPEVGLSLARSAIGSTLSSGEMLSNLAQGRGTPTLADIPIGIAKTAVQAGEEIGRGDTATGIGRAAGLIAPFLLSGAKGVSTEAIDAVRPPEG